MTNLATSRLALPLLAAGQAQKEMSHNEALTLLDLAVHGSVIAAGTQVPPASVLPGQCWIVGDAPEGDWAGYGNAVAGWTEGAGVSSLRARVCACGWARPTVSRCFRAEAGGSARRMGGCS